MEVHLEVRGDEALSDFVRSVYRDQLPFATSLAINNTAKAFQERQREHMRATFNIRNERFMARSVKIKPFASKRSLAAKVAIASPGGRDDIFAKFEEGGKKTPQDGRSIAIPRDELRTRTGRVKAREKLRRLEFKRVGRSVFKSKGTGIFKGRRRTFMIRESGGRGLVFRREGPGEWGSFEGTKLLWVLTPEGDIRPSLDFASNAHHIVDRVFDGEFSKAFDRALRSATPRGGRSRAVRNPATRARAFASVLGL